MLKRIFKSICDWLEDRTGLLSTISHLALHKVPSGARWWYVFGSATLCCFILQVVTGIALALYYIPSSNQAYQSLQYIIHDTTFGAFVRGLHYYGASAMILMVGLHLTQVFLHGSYKFPREMNWLTGVLLLGFTLGMGFTGQILRWDQNAVWTVIVGSRQALRAPMGQWVAQIIMGGKTVGGSTLERLFVIHVFLIPGALIAFIGLHLMLVLRHGISEPPVPGKLVDRKTYRQEYEKEMREHGVPFWPDAAWRDAVFAVAMILGIAFFAYFFGAPELGPPPDPSLIVANPHPDWYLLWIFAILAYLPPDLENAFMVFAPLVAGALLIIVPFISNRGERAPSRRPWAVAAVIGIVVMIGALWKAGVEEHWSPNFNPTPLSAQVIGATSGPVFDGAKLFEVKGCLNCHMIDGDGGRRGPDLTYIGDKLSANQMILRIANGATNMPAFAATLTPEEIQNIVAFLQSRKAVWKGP